MRRTSEVTDTTFPFAEDTTAFILIVTGDHFVDGHTQNSRGFEHASTFDKKLTLVEQAINLAEQNARVSLLAVWPGAKRSDVFLVDDLDQALATLA